MTTPSQYDGISGQYQQHAEDSPYNAHYDRPAVFDLLGDVADRDVLDAACGPGFYLIELLRRGARVTGFDGSEEMLALARQAVPDARLDLAALGEDLPYDSGSFDVVVCALAIHYTDRLADVFTEFDRVLRPGGLAVVSTQHPVLDWLRKGGSYFETKLETDLWELPTGSFPMQFWRVSLTELCEAATGAGFVITRLVEPRPAESMRQRWPEQYAKLNHEPGFLILQLRKLDQPWH